MNLMVYKFAFIAFCFILVLSSRRYWLNSKDGALLAGGLAFTVWADYFLILNNQHFAGVAVFCFVHICYILRCRSFDQTFPKWVMGLVAIVFVGILSQSIFVIAGIYAGLFMLDIFICTKTRLPRRNKTLMLAGLILFALCDINVLLFNLPNYFGAGHGISDVAFTLIWVFYLPSQVLIALSVVKFDKAQAEI